MKLQEYSNTLAQLIHDCRKELIHPKMKSINDDKESSQFFFTILFKLTNGLDSLNIFLINLENKPQFSDSLFICLRSLLLDMLTVDYLIIKSEFEEKNIQANLDSLKSDHVLYQIKNLKTYKEIFNLSESDYQKKRKELINHFNKYLNKNGKLQENLNKFPTSAGIMIKEIKKRCNNTAFLSNSIEAFEYYDLYSKYEHLGEYTTKLVFRGYHSENINSLFNEAKSCLRLLISFQYVLLTEFYKREKLIKTNYWKNYQLLT
ncbi:hypothetical protein [Wenyingzhuangia sp. IMCC45574]